MVSILFANQYIPTKIEMDICKAYALEPRITF